MTNSNISTHSDDEMELYRKYEEATDTEVLDFVRNVLSGEGKMSYVTVAFLPESTAIEIQRLTGKEVFGSRVVLDISAVQHIEKRHGKEGKQDFSMKNAEDIARMGYVIMNYDTISYGGVTTTGYLDEEGKPSPLIVFSKRIDGTYYVVEAVNSSRKKKNYVVTAYITNKKSSDLIPDMCIGPQDTLET